MAHNGLVRCPEETSKRLSCFKAEGLGAAVAMMSVRLFRSAKGEQQWDAGLHLTASFFLKVSISRVFLSP